MNPGLLPAVNALLNTTAAILLVVGHRMLRKGRIETHRKLMISAFLVSCLFLLSYLTYHSMFGSQGFWGTGWIRVVYLVILGAHSVCAAAIVPLAIVTLTRGLKRLDDKHRRVARWTYPIWLFVSVTGVIVYVMLYQLKAIMGG